ncbi:DUF4363 family protein [Clostridium tagluense]|uniref:DUF4363 family protein n=1 Tax=Clostridium tagluense TaxID=360422 RepID=UPI001CF4F8F6|nr:DUF4363 family protein [Clostridium tagluense]MCB2311008.1 DUF4363 family protein [Clostridium tagluense]MCB2316866.1 DUF4363 family protein [Clostridium tagluense]MCB2321752.1 DUF4363 family protein [Clostridium tagluense]MCB2325666.1 DUF4363 family protein [Clostridium tagluense]MCB2331458.1 DUF4363 family protein [Clostridium tagluense]
MKNVYLAFSLFIIMIIGIFFSINTINQSCANLQDLNCTLESYILKENYKDAYNLSLDYIAQWKRDSKFLTIYIHHEDLDHVDNEVLKLTQYIKTRNKSEALATVHVMKYLVDHIKSHEKVSISNIF